MNKYIIVNSKFPIKIITNSFWKYFNYYLPKVHLPIDAEDYLKQNYNLTWEDVVKSLKKTIKFKFFREDTIKIYFIKDEITSRVSNYEIFQLIEFGGIGVRKTNTISKLLHYIIYDLKSDLGVL
jgi:hypothetical protein